MTQILAFLVFQPTLSGLPLQCACLELLSEASEMLPTLLNAKCLAVVVGNAALGFPFPIFPKNSPGTQTQLSTSTTLNPF